MTSLKAEDMHFYVVSGRWRKITAEKKDEMLAEGKIVLVSRRMYRTVAGYPGYQYFWGDNA